MGAFIALTALATFYAFFGVGFLLHGKRYRTHALVFLSLSAFLLLCFIYYTWAQ